MISGFIVITEYYTLIYLSDNIQDKHIKMKNLTYNSFIISLPCFNVMENIEPGRRENKRLIKAGVTQTLNIQ